MTAGIFCILLIVFCCVFPIFTTWLFNKLGIDKKEEKKENHCNCGHSHCHTPKA